MVASVCSLVFPEISCPSPRDRFSSVFFSCIVSFVHRHIFLLNFVVSLFSQLAGDFLFAFSVVTFASILVATLFHRTERTDFLLLLFH